MSNSSETTDNDPDRINTMDDVGLTAWHGKLPERPWPDPTPEMLSDPRFNAIWNVIRSWDMNVPEVYVGYCGCTGNHARAIFDALSAVP